MHVKGSLILWYGKCFSFFARNIASYFDCIFGHIIIRQLHGIIIPSGYIRTAKPQISLCISAALSAYRIKLWFILPRAHQQLSKLIDELSKARLLVFRDHAVGKTGVPRKKHQSWMGDHYPVTCECWQSTRAAAAISKRHTSPLCRSFLELLLGYVVWVM